MATISKTVVATEVGPAELAAGVVYVHDVELDEDVTLRPGGASRSATAPAGCVRPQWRPVTAPAGGSSSSRSRRAANLPGRQRPRTERTVVRNSSKSSTTGPSSFSMLDTGRPSGQEPVRGVPRPR